MDYLSELYMQVLYTEYESSTHGMQGTQACVRKPHELQRNQNPYSLYVRAYVRNQSISLPCDVNTVGSLIDSI